MPLPSPPAAPSSGETAARPVERRLTVGAATAIAVTALIVFGAGVAIGKLAFPTSTDRSPGRLSAASRHRTGTADLVERVDDAAGHLHGSVAGRAACDVSAAPRHHSGAADLVERVDDAAGHLHGSVAGRAACDVSAAPRHHSGAADLVERVDAAAASSEAEALDDTASHQDGDVEHRRPDTERRLRLFRWEVPALRHRAADPGLHASDDVLRSGDAAADPSCGKRDVRVLGTAPRGFAGDDGTCHGTL